MFKKLFLTLALVLCLAVAGSAFQLDQECTLPAGSIVHLYDFEQEMFLFQKMVVAQGHTVITISGQPDAEWLKVWTEKLGKDWTDGVAVMNMAARQMALVHRNDLTDCK